MDLLNAQLSQGGLLGGKVERYDLSVRAFGCLDMLDNDTRETLMDVVERSRHGTWGVLNLCVAYTSQDEITRAMRKTVECCSSVLPATTTQITPQTLTNNMDTANEPPLDILVRTSGVTRLSDFLLWQCHQETDIQFVDALWPEFKSWDLFLVISMWQRRKAASKSSQLEKCNHGSNWWWTGSYRPPSAHAHVISVLCIMIVAIFLVTGSILR